jgi:beta-1,4-mannosyltransferase
VPSSRHRIKVAMDPCASPNPYIGLLQEALSLERVETIPLTARGACTAQAAYVHWSIDTLTSKRSLVPHALRFLSLLMIVRARGKPVVWTVHNLRGHEQVDELWARIVRALFVRLITGWTSLSSAACDDIVAAYPRLARLPRRLTPHGLYRRRGPTLTPSAARQRLGIPDADAVLVHFGRLRPYKNTMSLIDVVMASSGLHLVVAGPCGSAELREALDRASRRSDQVSLHLGYVPEEEVATYFAAADCAVMAYDGGLNSGVALLSLTHGTPALLPRRPQFEELQVRFGDRLVRLFEEPLTSAQLLRLVRTPAEAQPVQPDDGAWSFTAAALRSLFEN